MNKFLVIVFLLSGLNTALADTKEMRLKQLDALKRAADICDSTKQCNNALENVKVKLDGREIDAVKVNTPTGSTTYFRWSPNYEGFCYCSDCVSVPPTVYCQVL